MSGKSCCWLSLAWGKQLQFALRRGRGVFTSSVHFFEVCRHPDIEVSFTHAGIQLKNLQHLSLRVTTAAAWRLFPEDKGSRRCSRLLTKEFFQNEYRDSLKKGRFCNCTEPQARPDGPSGRSGVSRFVQVGSRQISYKARVRWEGRIVA